MKPKRHSPGKNPPFENPSAGESKPSPAEDDGFWALDDEPEAREAPEAVEPEPTEERESVPAQIPIAPRRKRDGVSSFNLSSEKSRKSAPKKSAADDPVTPEEEPTAPPEDHTQSREKRNPVEDTFDELEKYLWDDPEPAPDPEEPASSAEEEIQAPPQEIDDTPGIPDTGPVEETTAETLTDPAPEQEKPGLPKISPLTRLEKIGIATFAALLLAGGAFFMLNSVSKLPEEEKVLTERDFPIKGTRVEAVSLESYWRPPAGSDTVRRGTGLLPEFTLKVSGSGAVRFFFRNSDGETIGDGVTRAVNGPASFKIAATAGFEDIGTHGPYRTGDIKPWTIVALEGPSTDAPGDQFKPLFTIPISTKIR